MPDRQLTSAWGWTIPRIEIRPERPDDRGSIVTLLRQAFPGEPVAALVEALRSGPGHRPELALVAVDEAAPGSVLGFVMLTPSELEGSPWQPGLSSSVLTLSPLAVHPAATGHGVARALVEQALAVARARPEPYVVLEGDPALYSRFGFVPADELGLVGPSERIPKGAFQAAAVHSELSGPAGRVMYPPPFWEVVTPGLPFAGITWLDELELQARSVESAVLAHGDGVMAALKTPVPSCPGWVVADVLRHLGTIERVVIAWLNAGRRPADPPSMPEGDDPLLWFGRGWRRLHERLSADRPETPSATWCPWDSSNLFWRRRMVHEHAVHAFDVLESLGLMGYWSVPDDVAADGVEEVLRLWLGTRLGATVGGDGDAVRLTMPTGEAWTVVLHQRSSEIHRLEQVPAAGDAAVHAEPVTLYRWLWGRTGEDAAGVRLTGSVSAVAALRGALERALG
jgi:uncharacterized protein (TIGR03083 family)